MKHTEYKVVYKNGKTEIFYCFGFGEAIIRAMNYALDQAWNPDIESITDEYGKRIINIKNPTFEVEKSKVNG